MHWVIAFAAASLIQLQGTDGQVVWVNPAQVISIREPRGVNSGHWAKGTRCLVLTVDGKFFTTVDTCEEVRKKLGGSSGSSGQHYLPDANKSTQTP